MNKLTFRSTKIIYYGPHECGNCGQMIVKMGQDFGGNAFDFPDGPIYPNTEWHPHVCDPKLSKQPQPIEDFYDQSCLQCGSKAPCGHTNLRKEGMPNV